MSTNPIWIAAYGGPVAGASPVWIAGYGGPVAGAAEAWIAGYGGTPAAGASPVWIAGYGGAPAAAGASPIWIGGYLTAGGGGGGGSTSVWSTADATANGMTLSNGGLTVTPSGNASYQSIRGSVSKTSGKVYVEFATSVTGANPSTTSAGIGVANAGFTINTYLGDTPYSFGSYYVSSYTFGNGFTAIYSLPPGQIQAGDVTGMAVDFTAGKVWLAYNNTWIGTGIPATGTNPSATFTPATVGALFPAMAFQGTGVGVWTIQPTAASQKYAPPAGFSPWN